MSIDKGATAAIVIERHSVNLNAIRVFLRQNDHPENETRGTDESHLVFAKILEVESEY